MAVQAVLFIDGVKGPSTFQTDGIDILSFSWGVHQTQTYQAGSSGKEAKAGRADFSALTIMKVTDATTPLLMDHSASGNILPKTSMCYYKPVGDKQQCYFRLAFKDTLITSFQLSGSSENPTESVSFAYQAVEVGYSPEDDTGALGAAVRKGFNLATTMPDFAAEDAFPT